MADRLNDNTWSPTVSKIAFAHFVEALKCFLNMQRGEKVICRAATAPCSFNYWCLALTMWAKLLLVKYTITAAVFYLFLFFFSVNLQVNVTFSKCCCWLKTAFKLNVRAADEGFTLTVLSLWSWYKNYRWPSKHVIRYLVIKVIFWVTFFNELFINAVHKVFHYTYFNCQALCNK